MPVSFNNIPATIRVPLFYAEMDNSKAGTYQATYRTLLIGQITNPLFQDVNKAVYVSSVAQARSKFGPGSQLAQMVEAYLENNTSVEVYALPIADPASGTAASGSITVSGSSFGAGVLSLYVYDQVVQVGVSESDSASTLATAIAEAINANETLPITAEASEETVTLSAKHKGVIGNDTILGLNLGGEANGEETPAGVTININAMSGGAGNPEIDEAIANLGEEQYDFVVSGFTVASILKALSAYMISSSNFRDKDS